MTYYDWTIGADYREIASDTTDIPPGATAPSLSLRRCNDYVYNSIYPTTGSINGISVKGINQGQFDTWMKVISGYPSEFYMGFRMTNTTRLSTYQGYVCWFNMSSSSGLHVEFFHYANGVKDDIDGFFSTTCSRGISLDTWFRPRVKWWTHNSDLLMSVMIDYNDGNGFVTEIASRIDPGNANMDASSTNNICLMLNGYSLSCRYFKIDNTAVYSV